MKLIKYRKYLEIFSKSCQVWFLTFLIFDDQISYFECLDEMWFLKLKFDQKVKVWLFCVQLTFSSVDQISSINPLISGDELKYVIRSKMMYLNPWDLISNQ